MLHSFHEVLAAEPGLYSVHGWWSRWYPCLDSQNGDYYQLHGLHRFITSRELFTSGSMLMLWPCLSNYWFGSCHISQTCSYMPLL